MNDNNESTNNGFTLSDLQIIWTALEVLQKNFTLSGETMTEADKDRIKAALLAGGVNPQDIARIAASCTAGGYSIKGLEFQADIPDALNVHDQLHIYTKDQTMEREAHIDINMGNMGGIIDLQLIAAWAGLVDWIINAEYSATEASTNTLAVIPAIRNGLIPIPKLINEMTGKELQSGKQYGVSTAARGEKKGAFVQFAINYDSDKIKTSIPLTEDYRVIFNQVCTLIYNGYTFIWPQKIYETMNGGNKEVRLSDVRRQEIQRALDSFMDVIKIRIDCSDQVKHYNKRKLPITSHIIEGAMMPAIRHTITYRGEEISGYQLSKDLLPPLYTYSSMLSQIIVFDNALLDVVGHAPRLKGEKSRRSTPAINALTPNIIIHINMHKQKNIKRFNMLYDTVFEQSGIQTPHATQQARNRETVKLILSSFVAQGYIKSFTEYRKARKIAGVTIELEGIKPTEGEDKQPAPTGRR